MGTSMFGNETLKFTESHKENCAETNPQSFTGGGGAGLTQVMVLSVV